MKGFGCGSRVVMARLIEPLAVPARALLLSDFSLESRSRRLHVVAGKSGGLHRFRRVHMPSFAKVSVDLKSKEWDNKKSAKIKTASIEKAVEDNIKKYHEALSKEVDGSVSALKILHGILDQLEKSPSTHNFKIESAKALREKIKLHMKEGQTLYDNYDKAMLDWRGSKLSDIVDGDAVSALSKLRAKTQNREKTCDGYRKQLEANEVRASATYKRISVVSGGYDKESNVAEKFLSKAVDLHKKGKAKIFAEGWKSAQRLQNALDRITRDAANSKAQDDVVNSFSDVEKNQRAFIVLDKALAESWKSLCLLRDKCPSKESAVKISVLAKEFEEEVDKFFGYKKDIKRKYDLAHKAAAKKFNKFPELLLK